MSSTYSLVVLLGLISLSLGGCATLPAAPFPEAPLEWRIASNREIEPGDCRGLEGTFLMSAEQITYAKGNWKQETLSDLPLYSVLVGPAKAAKIPESRIEYFQLNAAYDVHFKSFQLKFENATDFYLSYFAGGNSSNVLHFSSERGEFSCKSAAISFPAKIDISGGEGVQANSQRWRVMGLNISGDLVLYDSRSPAKSSLYSPEPTFTIVKFTRNKGG